MIPGELPVAELPVADQLFGPVGGGTSFNWFRSKWWSSRWWQARWWRGAPLITEIDVFVTGGFVPLTFTATWSTNIQAVSTTIVTTLPAPIQGSELLGGIDIVGAWQEYAS